MLEVKDDSGNVVGHLAETLDEIPWFSAVAAKAHQSVLENYAFRRDEVPPYLRSSFTHEEFDEVEGDIVRKWLAEHPGFE